MRIIKRGIRAALTLIIASECFCGFSSARAEGQPPGDPPWPRPEVASVARGDEGKGIEQGSVQAPPGTITHVVEEGSPGEMVPPTVSNRTSAGLELFNALNVAAFLSKYKQWTDYGGNVRPLSLMKGPSWAPIKNSCGA